MRRLLLTVLLAAAGAATAQSDRQLLRGGVDADVFLGCLSCSRFEPDSVTNRAGTHGSETGYASIHNAHGIYGSRYADTSACNPYAQHPPAVVTAGGTFLGYLTLNANLPDAIAQPGVVAWLRDDVCG